MCKFFAQIVSSLLNSPARLCEFSQKFARFLVAPKLFALSYAAKIVFLSLTPYCAVAYNTFSPFHRLYDYDDL